jgi:hypothetical protein
MISEPGGPAAVRTARSSAQSSASSISRRPHQRGGTTRPGRRRRHSARGGALGQLRRARPCYGAARRARPAAPTRIGRCGLAWSARGESQWAAFDVGVARRSEPQQPDPTPSAAPGGARGQRAQRCGSARAGRRRCRFISGRADLEVPVGRLVERGRRPARPRSRRPDGEPDDLAGGQGSHAPAQGDGRQQQARAVRSTCRRRRPSGRPVGGRVGQPSCTLDERPCSPTATRSSRPVRRAGRRWCDDLADGELRGLAQSALPASVSTSRTCRRAARAEAADGSSTALLRRGGGHMPVPYPAHGVDGVGPALLATRSSAPSPGASRRPADLHRPPLLRRLAVHGVATP